MKSSRRVMARNRSSFLGLVLIPVATLFAASAARAEIPQNAHAAQDAVYPCDAAGDTEQLLARARTLASQTHDRNKLGCAADLFYQVAQQGVPAAGTLAQAVAAHNVYMEQVGIEKDLDFIGVQTGEWMARLARSGTQVQSLAALAAKHYPDDPALQALCAQADLLVHHYDDPRDFVAATKRAIPVLTRVAESSPAVIDGKAMVYLGRLYLELPAFFGGDSARAVKYLESARSIDPRDADRLASLAKAYDEAERPADAVGVLRELLAIEPREGELQSVADAWMVGIGLAGRLQDGALQQSFTAKRHALLAAHRELMTRARTAVGGHGGEDPLTGERQY